jgi:predicted MFS family arabinose efflux permease
MLAAGIFVLSVTVECLRPANTASVAFYARPENVTRSFSLNRMAVNLGFSIGPALGGLLATFSYKWLFIADGITCIAAGIFFYVYFRNKTGRGSKQTVVEQTPAGLQLSPYRDIRFLVFLFFTTCYAVVFFQFFNTLPLYYHDVYRLSESEIGLLLGFNGLLVFLFEMLVVHKVKSRIASWRLVVVGALLCGVSYMLLNVAVGVVILLLAMILVTFSEIFAMPFMITFTVERSGEKNRGAYIGLYTLAFSAAFILAPYLGTRMIDKYSYDTLWWVAGLVSVPTALGFLVTMREKKKQPVIS